LKKTSPSSSSKGSNFAREQYLYLTTRGRKTGQPREIEIWFTEHGGRFYLIAEYPKSHWIENLRADPAVQVRIAGQSFPARARVLDPQVYAQVRRAIEELSRRKYGWGEGTVVELRPTSPLG
jgi:deazaflavin-dependent oxidoreductase (nitroreductase family)